MDDQIDVIRGFIARHANGIEFTDEEDLFASGYVNSLFAVQLVMFVERTFDVSVVGDELDIENFSSVARVDRFVTGKRAAVPARRA